MSRRHPLPARVMHWSHAVVMIPISNPRAAGIRADLVGRPRTIGLEINGFFEDH